MDIENEKEIVEKLEDRALNRVRVDASVAEKYNNYNPAIKMVIEKGKPKMINNDVHSKKMQ